MTARRVCLELMFHRDFWGHLVLPQSSHMCLSDHVEPEHPQSVFPAPPLFSWPLTQDLSLCFVVQVRVPAPAPAQPRGHILVCRCAGAGKEFPGAPHGDADPLWFPSQGSGQARGPAGSQHRSQRAPTSQRWDSRLAWRVAFDVVLSWAAFSCCYDFN